MAYLWIGTLFCTAQITGAVIWIPIVLTVLGMAGVFIVNTFILGGKFEKKANTDDVVLLKQYEKDSITLNEKMNSKADRDILEAYIKLSNQHYIALHERMGKVEEFKDEANRHYINISGQLGAINKSISSIERNCDKQTCRSIKK